LNNVWWETHKESHPALCYLIIPHRPTTSSAPYSPTSSAYIPPSMWETKFHISTKKQTKLYSFIFESSDFVIANWKTRDFILNDSKHFMASNCSYFLHEWNFDLLGLSQICQLCHTFKRFLNYLYVVILSHIQFMRPKYTWFLSIYF
jgi:hypothetical protein